MLANRAAADVLNREFLEVRCKILELAAAMDRLDRATGSVADDPRLAKIHEAMEVVADQRSDRAEQVQLIFSRPYHDHWQREMNVVRGGS